MKRLRLPFERGDISEIHLGLIRVKAGMARALPHVIPRERDWRNRHHCQDRVPLRAPKQRVPMAKDASYLASVDVQIVTQGGVTSVGHHNRHRRVRGRTRGGGSKRVRRRFPGTLSGRHARKESRLIFRR